MRSFAKIFTAALLLVLAAFAMCGFRPVVDAGHGGFDGGAVAADGTPESELNLAISVKLRWLLLLLGEEPVMVREEDTALGSGDTIRAAKSADLKERVRIADATENGFVISIHQNAFGDSRYRGAQVFWSHDEARPLAELVQYTLRTALDPENARVIKPVPKEVYLFRKTVRPAILVECGFLTNGADLERLKDDGYRTKLACVAASCFVRYNRGENIVGE